MALIQDELGNWYDDGSDPYDFWESIGVDPNTTMENWKSPSNIEIESAIQGDPGWLTLAKKFGAGALDMLKTNGKYDIAKMAALGIGAYNMANKGDSGGYNKPVPKMTATMQQIPYAQDPNRRPGEAGRRYFTDTQFTPQGDAGKLAEAQAAATAQAQGIMAAAPQYAAPAPNPYAGKIPVGFSKQQTPVVPATAAGLPAIPTREQIDMQNQQRAAMPMARGGIADAGRYLQGKTDGMADEIETSIDGKQPALLSHGEFVIPADVVSHLGNGNSEAGADKLYSMMDKIRQARTGTKKQGKEIDADKFIEAASGGLAAAYASGGKVQRFQTGGALNTPTPTTTGAGGIPQDVSRTSTLSPWVGDYVTSALGQGAALANAPYQAYQGPLTAGASNLQQQAFAGASDIARAGYMPGSFVGGFNAPLGGGMGGAGQPMQSGFDRMPIQGGVFQPQSTIPGRSDFVGLSNIGDTSQSTQDVAAAAYGQDQGQTAAGFENILGGSQPPQGFGQPRSLAAQYMNPYIQASLDPQLKELQRQADIQRVQDAGRLTQAGAFGGSRQAIMESEGRRNLLDKQAGLIGTGYKTAYDTGLGQFNKEREAEEASRQFGANFGLKSVGQLADLGATERGITSEGLAADRAQFEAERDFAYKMPQYQLGLLSGLPIGANTTAINQDTLSKLQTDIGGLASLYKTLAGLRQTK